MRMLPDVYPVCPKKIFKKSDSERAKGLDRTRKQATERRKVRDPATVKNERAHIKAESEIAVKDRGIDNSAKGPI